jgi:hypothetical protein
MEVGVDSAKLGTEVAKRGGKAGHVRRRPCDDDDEILGCADVAMGVKGDVAASSLASNGELGRFTRFRSCGGDLAGEPVPAQRSLESFGLR